jgi:hypothetical protein
MLGRAEARSRCRGYTSPGHYIPLAISAPTARATTQTTTTTDNVTKAPPTPSRAKPMDGPSKPSKKRPPTGFRRRSRRHAKRAPKAARVTSQMARR